MLRHVKKIIGLHQSHTVVFYTSLSLSAGSTADAITLFERLESKIEEHPGQLLRACVELAKVRLF